MIIDLSCYPTKEVDSAWRHDGDPFTGERPAVRDVFRRRAARAA